MKKIFLFILLVTFANSAFASYTQTSVFLPFSHFYEDQEIKFSIRVKNPTYKVSLLNFNTSCHMRYRIYKDNQLVFPSNLLGTCFGFNSNKIILNPMDAIEHEFRIPEHTFSTGKYLIVSTVNNVDLKQVRAFEVIKRPKLIAKIGETCGGFANIQCASGLTCNQGSKESTSFGYCEISDINIITNINGTSYGKINLDEQIQKRSETKNDQNVTKSEFLGVLSSMKPNLNSSTKSLEYITKEFAIKTLINSFYKDQLKPSLDGFYFVDTIFSDAQKEIDFAYENKIINTQGLFFYPNSYLKWSELNEWIKNLK